MDTRMAALEAQRDRQHAALLSAYDRLKPAPRPSGGVLRRLGL
jgi:hypothetical protein